MIHKEDNEMKFKKVAALVLASAMTLGLAACGNGNSSTPSQSSGGASSSGTTSSSATEISLWSFNIGGFTEASNWDSLIAAFNCHRQRHRHRGHPRHRLLRRPGR